jgi:hypothetical protein
LAAAAEEAEATLVVAAEEVTSVAAVVEEATLAAEAAVPEATFSPNRRGSGNWVVEVANKWPYPAEFEQSTPVQSLDSPNLADRLTNPPEKGGTPIRQ